ncbi:MAG: response regulator [Nitrospirae bacterium]|nr:response regulator [Nitrospirota bacterium]
MKDNWNLLVIDDEKDIHDVTEIALKRKKWRNRGLSIIHAYSAGEAKKILKEYERAFFEIALVDVVMETDDAGLELCKYIRDNQPNTLRIILRTGQAGKAPEEQVMNEYDIDHYLPKSDASPDRIFSLIRSCLHSSQDLSTLRAYGDQMKSLVQNLPLAKTESDLLILMDEALRFLDIKHASNTLFFYNIDADSMSEFQVLKNAGIDVNQILQRLKELHGQYENSQLCYDYKQVETELDWKIMLFQTPCRKEMIQLGINEKYHRKGAFVFNLNTGTNKKYLREYIQDASIFLENWCMASESLRLQNQVEEEKMLREKMYYERLEGIATMVTGVAHEMNTPLGVAMTSNQMIQTLAQELLNCKDEEERQDIVKDFTHSCSLLERNIVRAQELIKSFKQLSSTQLTDQYDDFDIGIIVKDCIETMSPELNKKQIKVLLHLENEDNEWKGYASHLSQVIINMLQNMMRYAYKGRDSGGAANINVFYTRGDSSYIIEIEDYGNGISSDILPFIFDPFVTTGRKDGGTGLGLSISHNIVTNILGGKIECNSEIDKGTKFTIKLPKEVIKK